MLPTASTLAPRCCEPVPCCGGLTWVTDSSSSSSGSHSSVSSGFFPAFWKRKSTKGSACRQESVGNMIPHPSFPPPHLCMGLRLLLPSMLPLQLFNNWDAAAPEPEPST